MTNPKVGDLVRFSADFCELVGPSAKKMRGEVVHVYEQVRPNGPFRLSVLWRGDEQAKGVLSSNLAKVRGKL